MVDPAANIAQWNLAFELHQRWARRLRGCPIGCKRHCHNRNEAYDTRVTHHYWLPLLSIGFQTVFSAGYRLAGGEVAKCRLDCIDLDHHHLRHRLTDRKSTPLKSS